MNHSLLRRNAKAALSGGLLMVVIGTLVYLAIESMAGIFGIVGLLVTGPLTYGYVKFITKQVDEGQQDLNELFVGLNRFLETMVAGLVLELLVGIGCILLIVPGIIVACGLSQTYFIMAENPTISGTDALQQSWNMMRGHKMDYFVFILGFIGWLLLCVITLGILTLYVEPYITASQLNYYRALRSLSAPVPPAYRA